MSRAGSSATGDLAARLTSTWNGLPDVAKGFALVGVGIVILSPDALLIRLMTVDEGTLLFLRGGIAVVGYLVLIRFHEGAVATLRTWALSRPELAIAGLAVFANVLFVISIRHVNAALALVIISSAPAFTALLSRLVGDSIAPRTWIASLVVLGGVAAIFAAEPEGGDLIGALAAVGASVTLAVMLVVRRRTPSVRMLRSLAIGAGLTALVASPFASPWSVSASDLGLALIMGLVVLPVSLDLIWRAPRYITAPEVSLVSLMEAVLGPLWVWLVVGEGPTTTARRCRRRSIIGSGVAMSKGAISRPGSPQSPRRHGGPRATRGRIRESARPEGARGGGNRSSSRICGPQRPGPKRGTGRGADQARARSSGPRQARRLVFDDQLTRDVGDHLGFALGHDRLLA